MLLESIDRRNPRQEVFLVLFGVLDNQSDSRECVYARDIRFIIDADEYAPQGGLMDTVRDNLENKIDFVGAVAGQCVDAGSEDETFIAFDIPNSVETETNLRFFEDEQDIVLDWTIVSEIDSEPELLENYALFSTQQAETIQAIFESTGTALAWTDTPSPTPTVTPTDRQTNTPTLTNTVEPQNNVV